MTHGVSTSRSARRASGAGALMTAGAFIAALALAPLEARGQERALAHGAGDAGLEWGPCPAFMPEGCAIAVLHGDPASENADVFFKLPAGAEAGRHWHHSPERMVLSRGEMRVAYDGQDPVRLAPGDYAYGPAKAPHSAACVSDEDCVLFIAFEEPVDAFAGAPDE